MRSHRTFYSALFYSERSLWFWNTIRAYHLLLDFPMKETERGLSFFYVYCSMYVWWFFYSRQNPVPTPSRWLVGSNMTISGQKNPVSKRKNSTLVSWKPPGTRKMFVCAMENRMLDQVYLQNSVSMSDFMFKSQWFVVIVSHVGFFFGGTRIMSVRIIFRMISCVGLVKITKESFTPKTIWCVKSVTLRLPIIHSCVAHLLHS